MTHDSVTSSVILHKPHFDLSLRGYEKAQVDEHLARVSQEVTRLTTTLRQERDYARSGSQQLIAERDDALRQLRTAQQELAALRGGGPGAQQPVRDDISLFGDRLQTILATAEQEASAAKAEALATSVQTSAEARRQAETLLAEAKQQATALLSRATDEAATLRADAEQEADAQLTRARTLAEELTGQAKAEAEQAVSAARREAAELLDEARRTDHQTRAQLTELVQRREQIRRELTGIRAAVEGLLGTVAAPAAEPAKTA